jgi:phage tail-like protein
MTTGIKRRTAHIEARTADGHVVAQWGLLEVVPVRWSGPSFSPESPKVAVETIEIAHHGYVMGS